MPIPHNVIRYQGSLPQGEEWSVTTRFGTDQGQIYTDYSDLATWAESIAEFNGGQVFTTAMWAMMSSAVKLDTIRIEYRDADGELNQVAEQPVQPYNGIENQARLPFQCSLVTSLLTGRPGRSYRGRIYWPALGLALSPTTLRVNTQQLELLNMEIESFLSSAEDRQPVEDAVTMCVVSQKLNIATPVTQIQMGDVVDTQRRRRDALREVRFNDAYSS